MSALKDRLLRLGRREAPGLAGRDASRLFSAPVPVPGGGEQAPPGSLTPQARRQLDEALARGMRTGERPYADTIPADQLAAYRLAAAQSAPQPAYYPAAGAAPATAPHPVVPAMSDLIEAERERREITAAHMPCETAQNGTGARCTCSFDCANYWLRARGHGQADYAEAPAGTLDMTEVLKLRRRLVNGIRGIDGKALDAARAQEGLTYARTIGAPFHNALLTRWRSPVRPAHRHGEAATRRAESLAYPAYDVTEAAGHGAYADVMRHADLITGTRGTGRWLPALPAGGAQ